MKKLIALFVSTLLFATSLTSLAAGAPASAQDTATQEALTKAEQYAYLDLDSASPSMQQKILDARNESIASTSNDSSLTLSSSEVTPFSNSDWLRLGSTRHYLPAASNSHDASPFSTFTVDSYSMGTIIRSYATSLTSSKNCNIGYTKISAIPTPLPESLSDIRTIYP